MTLPRAVSVLFFATMLRAADPVQLPNGFSITPSAIPHSVDAPLNPGLPDKPNLTLSQPVTTVLSPDGTRMLALTSGFNKERGVKGGQTNEFVFVYDVTSFPPKQLQALPVANAFCGLAWNPNGAEFYVSGGVDDKVYIFARDSQGLFARAAMIGLGHAHGNGLLSDAGPPHDKDAPKPMAGGIAVNKSGTLAVVANFYNDSISTIDLQSRKKAAELDLRPGVLKAADSGKPGGEYPYWIAIRGDDTAYVSSPRDREIVAVGIGASLSVKQRIPVRGQPNRLILNRAQTRLFAAVDNADAVTVVDTTSNRVLNSISVVAPEAILGGANLPKGANPNSLALSPDEQTLYVTDGGTNAVAVVDVAASRVRGLIPTGWYPNSVTVSADGKYLYIANSKSVPGPNSGYCRGDVKAPGIPDCKRLPNNYVYQLEKGSLLSAPVPSAAELAALTQRVAENNHFASVRARAQNPVMEELRKRIQHVIYIVKENRTYDQVLGDLNVGNGDPALAEFPEPLTPNHHALARNFVTLDNFYDSGEVSGVGWNWTVAARTTDYTEKTVPPNYAQRGFEYDWEGTNRNINIGIATLAERRKAQPLLALSKPDPDLLPGTLDVAAPDSAEGDVGSGYLWDEALRAAKTVRNYGFFCDLSRYDDPKTNTGFIPISPTPYASKIVQAVTTARSLIGRTDEYFRSFDQKAPDYYRFKEWEREFDEFEGNGKLPNLTLLRLAHDHFGAFGEATYGINTPGLQITDNDYAVGLVAEKVSKSRYAGSTLIFIIEDDAQDGPDHVDAHRSIAYVIGPYVKQRAVVSERYNTVSMIRTIESILGLETSSLYAAASAPMSQVFDLKQSAWTYAAKVPDLLRTSQLPLPARTAENSLPQTPQVLAYGHEKHNATYWQKRMGDMDFDVEDKLDTARFNRELWKGMMGAKPFPKVRAAEDLRENRQALAGVTTIGW
jgi:YVTN family beta-propeller protein